MQLRYFALSEFACHCNRVDCDAPLVYAAHLHAVDELRHLWGNPLSVNSGSRCAFWNKHEGGEDHSRHMVCDATDFRITADQRYAFIGLAIAQGFTGIGVGKSFVHVDSRPLAFGSSRKFWTY